MDFYQFLHWVDVVVFKELNIDSFYFGGGCGGPGRTDF